MHRKKIAGIVLLSMGLGMLFPLLIPQFFWCVFAAITLITLGTIFLKFEKKQECNECRRPGCDDRDRGC